MLMSAFSCTNDAGSTLNVVLLFHILQVVEFHLVWITETLFAVSYFVAFSLIYVYKIMVSMHGHFSFPLTIMSTWISVAFLMFVSSQRKEIMFN